MLLILFLGLSALPATSLKHVVVVGAGFSGWGAVKSLLDAGDCRVTLVDAADDPTGNKGSWTKGEGTTTTIKPFDNGQKGFWMDYPNLYGLLEKDLGLTLDSCFTPCTNSSFYSPFGLEATAPVFGEAPTLPSPLGQVAASARLFERLPITDRASVAGLLAAILDLTPETMAEWDSINAQQLFSRFGLSKRLVDDFLTPTLLVGLFKPPEELSAAVVMELLYFYALAHQTSFDVRWIKKGTVASTIFKPLFGYLTEKYGERLRVLPSTAVSQIGVNDGASLDTTVRFKSFNAETKTTTEGALEEVDGLVLAVGAKGLRSILSTSPSLSASAPQLAAASTMSSIDCIAVRLWLDKKVKTRSPANVFANFDCLRGAGGTFFMLDQLQPDEDFLWGGAPSSSSDRGSVLACDFYNSGALMSLSDADLVDMLLKELLPAAVPEFRGSVVVDSFVQRCPGAVNCFSPGSFKKRPRTNVEGVPRLKVAGDYVWMGDREPLSKGLCQERAFVSGIEAAAALAKELALPGAASIKPLPVRADEPQVVAGRAVSKLITNALYKLPLSKTVLSKLLWPRGD
jgi:uncharacterized protein with NAD-binding domain and iron-sulfur cluster